MVSFYNEPLCCGVRNVTEITYRVFYFSFFIAAAERQNFVIQSHGCEAGPFH